MALWRSSLICFKSLCTNRLLPYRVIGLRLNQSTNLILSGGPKKVRTLACQWSMACWWMTDGPFLNAVTLTASENKGCPWLVSEVMYRCVNHPPLSTMDSTEVNIEIPRPFLTLWPLTPQPRHRHSTRNGRRRCQSFNPPHPWPGSRRPNPRPALFTEPLSPLLAMPGTQSQIPKHTHMYKYISKTEWIL